MRYNILYNIYSIFRWLFVMYLMRPMYQGKDGDSGLLVCLLFLPPHLLQIGSCVIRPFQTIQACNTTQRSEVNDTKQRLSKLEVISLELPSD